MIRRPPRSTLFPYTTALPIWLRGRGQLRVPRDEHVRRSQLPVERGHLRDRKSTRLNSSHPSISYAVFCLKKKKIQYRPTIPIKNAFLQHFLPHPTRTVTSPLS